MPVTNQGSGVKAGMVGHYAADAIPAGWLKANGAAVSRAAYAALFAAIGTTYGAGDGVNTFNLPDLRGEFVRGLDDGRGVDTGRAVGSAQGDAMQGHKHRLYYRAAGTGGGSGGLVDSTVTLTRDDGVGNPVADGVNGTPRTAGETRPRNVAMLACIKY